MCSAKGCDRVWNGKLPEWISDSTYYNSRCVEENCFSTPHLTFQPGPSGFPLACGIGNLVSFPSSVEFQGNVAFLLTYTVYVRSYM